MRRLTSRLIAPAALVAAGAAMLIPSAGGAKERPAAAELSSRFESPLAALDFPLLVALRDDPAWAEALRRDEALGALVRERAGRVAAAEACTDVPRCRVAPWLWSEKDIAVVGARLAELAQVPALRKSLITDAMRPSRKFALHEPLDDGAFLVAAWSDAARGMNTVLRVYSGGEAPRYPAIDAGIFDTSSSDYAALLKAQDTITRAQERPDDLFFEAALRHGVTALIVNERTDAAQHRPVLAGDNAPTVEHLRHVAWRDYPYTALLLFGHGPEDALSRTGPLGHLRLRLAADRLHRGLAPVIILSGGAVHPGRTRYNEAVEMRRELIDHYAVPADRILIEPHARHTTTNLRNVARMMLSAGFPTDRDALILSTPETIGYIGGEELARRNLSELGYLPGTIAPGPDALSMRFRPAAVSFHVDAMDPLDP